MVNSTDEVQVIRNGGGGGDRGSSSPTLLPSNNGNQTSDQSSDEEREGRIRVGREYQAVPPPYIPKPERRPDQCPERALLVWSPTSNISNKKLEEFIQVAKEKYSYNAEQALGMLFWHKHDLDRALQDLSNFTPFPDEWSVEDKVLFEQAFQFHGKSFLRIRQMLPDKSIAALVKYYYSWKKTRTRTSLMDRQAKKLQVVREEEARFGTDAFVDEDPDDTEGSEKTEVRCGNCGISCHAVHDTPKGKMCATCQAFFNRTGQVRPTTGPLRKDGLKLNRSLFRNSTKPPKGMHINHDDLLALATGPGGQGVSLLKSLDREGLSFKRQLQNNKQILSSLRQRPKMRDIEPYRVPEPSASRINARWTNEELLLAVQGIRKFGKDFKTVAEILGTKTEAHLRSFFVNYKRRYNLEAVLKEYEAEYGAQADLEEKMDVDGEEAASPTSTPPATPGTPKTTSAPGTPKGSSAPGTPKGPSAPGTPKAASQNGGSPRSKSPAAKV